MLVLAVRQHPLGTAVALLVKLFLDSRRTTASLSQVIQLGLAHITTTLHGNRLNEWTMKLEGSLNTYAVRHLSQGEG